MYAETDSTIYTTRKKHKAADRGTVRSPCVRGPLLGAGPGRPVRYFVKKCMSFQMSGMLLYVLLYGINQL